jgi:hypothetical protein
MRDISLLMASVLTTGQTTVPQLPEALPQKQSSTQQQLKPNQQIEVAPSTQIAPPELFESDNTQELRYERCNYSHCPANKQSEASGNSSRSPKYSDVLHKSENLISSSSEVVENSYNLNLEHQNILKKSRSKIQLKHSFNLTQKVPFKVEQVNIEKIIPSLPSTKTFASQSVEIKSEAIPPQQPLSEASQSSGSILLPSILNQQSNQLNQQEDISNFTQNFPKSDSKELEKQDKYSNSVLVAQTKFSESENPMSQVTSVSELDDVSPTDWAFEALQSLVNRHNCALAYKDGTFQGNRVINRYEFATGVDACLQKINELIASKGGSTIDEQDLIILQRLQNEFRAELNQLEERIISLEERTNELQANRFSPTTRFFGQATTSLQGTNKSEFDLFPRDGVPERTAQTNLTFANSMQITLATSFTGRDLLLTGLYAGNLGSSASSLFTNMGRLSFESDTDNDVLINDLSYRFPISDNLGVVVGAAGVNPTSTFRGINPLEGEAISSFAQRNPIIGIGSGTGGVGFDWQINNRMSLQGIYSAQFPSFPADKNVGGLFGGRRTLGAQLTVTPVNDIDVGLHYLYSQSPDSLLATGVGDAQLTSPFAPTTAFDTQAVGATVAWRINPNLQLGGWGGWTFSNPEDIQGSVTTNNWAVFAAFPNLGRRGNKGGIIVGQPPKITSSSLPDGFNFPNFSNQGIPGGRDGTSLHVEMFYRAQLNQNLDITPGFFVVFNPDHNQSNQPLIIGALKATFRF